MASKANAVNSRVKGLQFDYSEIFQNRLAANTEMAMLNRVMGRIPNTLNAREADFHFFTAPPEFSLWEEGTKRRYGRLFDRTWKVPVLRYGTGIEWDRLDEEDDLTDRFRTQMEGISDKAIEIEIEAYFAILSNTVNPQYLKAIPLGADGLPVFSAARTNYFPGGGNIVVGSGVSTPAQIITDYFRCRSRFKRVRDDANTRYFGEGIFKKGITLVFDDIHMKTFTEAFKAKTIQGNAAAPENIVATITEFGPVTFWGTSRLPAISPNTWYMILDGQPEKGIFALERRDLGSEPETILKTEQESDRASDYDTRRLLFRKRLGFGVSLPLGMMQITNV